MLRVACIMDAALGEGPVWLAQEQVLWFVDIKRGRLHRFDPASGACRTLEVGGTPSFIVPIEGGGLLVGNGHALLRLEDDLLGAAIRHIDAPSGTRMNDATVDDLGRLWFGTMDMAERNCIGAVHVLHGGVITRTRLDAVVTNGPAISTDGKWLYHVDSTAGTIRRVAVESAISGSVGEVFVQLREEDGYPDGVVVDSQDCLWVALWDGWGVRRYGPDGALLLHVELPCSRPTKIAFGGPSLTTAYVTSARAGLDRETLARQPLAGSLFAFKAPAPGRLLPHARLQR